jgi:hypothetical protein
MHTLNFLDDAATRLNRAYINHVRPHILDKDISSMGNPLAVPEIPIVKSSKVMDNGPESIVRCIAPARQPW